LLVASAARKTPPLGGAGFRLPKLSKGTGAAERVRGGPMFRIEWAASPVAYKALTQGRPWANKRLALAVG